ncbi:hypothetical protein O3M35_012524 [Rhynocoris fuscipes]|uniref:Uncharacterized protein n=1 Tax=Rhynocoris fuscipes TaxID=488301 RepID=A0AAW1CTU0_9HEMI
MLKQHSCTDADVTWSNALIIKDNRAIISGFLNGKPGASVPLETPDNDDIIQGTCDQKHCFLITKKGKCWQYNIESLVWKEINYLPLTNSNENSIIKVALGVTVNAALTNKGEVWNFGNQLSSAEMKVVDIDCGKEHGILLTDSGYVYTWGSGSRGQLGNGTLDNYEDICEVHLLAGLNISKISAGGWHNAVLSKDGDIYTWGWNKKGQLGHPMLDGTNKNGVAVLAEPRVVDWPNSLNIFVKEISCGTSHTVALLENGELWGCGWNKWGQLGTTAFESTHVMFKLEISPLIIVRKIKCAAWNTIIIC